MSRYLLVLAGWLAAASAAYPQISVKDIEARYGQYGPERIKLEYHHREQVCLRFLITGAKTDELGLTDIQLAIELIAPDGTQVGEASKRRRDPLAFGNSFPEVITFDLPSSFPAGVYKISSQVTDNHTGQAASFERSFRLLPETFTITPPEFFYDSERRLDAPAGGLVNQRLHFRSVLIGFQRAEGKVSVTTRFQVLEAATRRAIKPSFRELHHAAYPLLPPDSFEVTGDIALHQAGDFLLQISATDGLSGEEICLEVPLRVQACWPVDGPRAGSPPSANQTLPGTP